MNNLAGPPMPRFIVASVIAIARQRSLSASVEADFHALFESPSALFDNNMRCRVRHSAIVIPFVPDVDLHSPTADRIAVPLFSVEKISRHQPNDHPFRHSAHD